MIKKEYKQKLDEVLREAEEVPGAKFSLVSDCLDIMRGMVRDYGKEVFSDSLFKDARRFYASTVYRLRNKLDIKGYRDRFKRIKNYEFAEKTQLKGVNESNEKLEEKNQQTDEKILLDKKNYSRRDTRKTKKPQNKSRIRARKFGTESVRVNSAVVNKRNDRLDNLYSLAKSSYRECNGSSRRFQEIWENFVLERDLALKQNSEKSEEERKDLTKYEGNPRELFDVDKISLLIAEAI